MSLILLPDGPGVTVQVLDGPQGLPSAPRGTAAVMGRFVSGPTSKAALLLTRDQARLVCGDPDQNFRGNLSLDDVYSVYTPPVLAARITDGLGVQAKTELWDRDPPRSVAALNSTLIPLRDPLGTAKAHNVGRWGGRKKVLIGTASAIATDLTATTFDAGASANLVAVTWLEDMLAGAIITFEGDDGSYEVESNDNTGVVTIKGEFSQALQDASGSGAINGRFRIILDHDKELAVVVGPDNVVGERFSLGVHRKFSGAGQWEMAARYDNLQLGSDEDRPWVATITRDEEELGRYQIAVVDDYGGSTTERKLPCNFSEVPIVVAANVMTYQWYRWEKTSGTGNGIVTVVTANDSSKIEPHILTATFTAATQFTLTATFPDGTVIGLLTGASTSATVNTQHPQSCAIRINPGTVAFTAGAVITIRVQPLPLDLYQREAFLYPIAVSDDGTPTQRLRIVANTYNTISVRSDLDLDDYGCTIGTSPEALGSVNLAAVSLTAGETVILTPDGTGVAVTLTSAGSGPGVTAIAAELEALDTAGFFIFDADPAAPTKLRIRLANSFGSQSSLLVGAGTANTALGLTATTTYGTDAIPFRIEARWPMWGGYDGVEPAAARFTLAADLSNSLFKCWMNTNLGLVRLCAPELHSGVSGGTAAMAAIIAFCEANGWHYLAELDESLYSSSTPGEAAVASLQANFSESDHVEWRFPSQLVYATVNGQGTVERSCMGQIAGLYAYLANVGVDGEKGLHIAAANNNVQGKLSPRAKGLPAALGRWDPPKKLLNDHGIVAILWEGPSVYMWGNRMYSIGRTPKGNRYTITERAVFYHIARDLFITARPNIFKSISSRRLGEITVQLRTKMRVYYNDGWFNDQGGAAPGFEDQVVVEVPLRDNPPEELLEGNVRAKITFQPRPALENLTITLAPTQTVAG